MRKQLFWSILAACVTLVVTVTVTAEVAQQAAARQRAVENLRRAATTVATRLEELPPAVTRSDEAQIRLNDFIDGVQSDSELVLRVGFVEPNGIAYLDGSTGPLDAAARAELEAGMAITSRFRTAERAEVLSVGVPASVGPRIGVVVAELEIARWSWRNLVTTWRVPFLFAIAVSAVASLLVAGRFTRRLRDLSQAVSDYTLGQRPNVDVAGGDEVAEVAAAFNVMAADLDAARRRENDFLMDVSHDLRTPLTTVVGYSEMLESNPDPATAHVGKALNTEARRLDRLVGDLMLLGRLRASHFAARSDTFELTGVIAGVVEGVRSTANDKDVSISVVGDSITLESDVERVQQIVGNILDNALRHTPKGGEVSVTVTKEDDRAVVRVADSGPGVPRERLATLFERLDAGPDRPAGSGLGLAIVRELTTLLGGDVTAANVDPNGLAITVRLPTS